MNLADLYKQIQAVVGNMPASFSIMEAQVSLEEQFEYHEASAEAKKMTEEELREKLDMLWDVQVSVEERKVLLSKLGSLEAPWAFRIIEKYLEAPDLELKAWAELARNECVNLLESKLLDENKVVISTGLGGKGNMLRYFAVFASTESKTLTESQQKIIQIELQSAIEKQKSEVEKIEFGIYYFAITFIMPLEADLKDVFSAFIEECNVYGNFLSSSFIVSNLKIFQGEELSEYVASNSHYFYDNEQEAEDENQL